jgi:NAD(P)-dependent dehydrogenase (short-subunit alcohol dehydrogenase family)
VPAVAGATTAFEGRTAIVTGGASGIGRALGAELLELGGRVVLADIDGEAAVQAAAEMKSDGQNVGSVAARELDVRDGPRFRSLVDEIVARDGRLDLLFNNAGISLGGPTHELTTAHWDRIIDVNIRGVVNGVLAAYPGMISQRRGHIINTASGAGLAGLPFVTAYAATKHAVVGLSAGLRPEAALHGVRVSVLCPGAVETPILDQPGPFDLPPTASATVTARAYLTAMRQHPMPADAFARRALRQVARNRAVIVLPSSAKSLWYAQRLSPRLVEHVAGLLARKVNRDLVRPSTPSLVAVSCDERRCPVPR